jgi:DNA-binding GntR family transcriptional regulator
MMQATARPPAQRTADPKLKSANALTSQLAAQIVDFIREEDLPEGEPLSERRLAERMKVSRSPIRNALRLLADSGIVRQAERGVVVSRADFPASLELDDPENADEAAYLAIADHRLHGQLPERITENELMRRFDLTRGRLARVLRRMAQEGWVERLPGHGWAFLPMMTSVESYEDSYRFRLLIEPAAILEPRFRLNRPAVERVRDEQRWLQDGNIFEISTTQLFDIHARFHHTIIECSGNAFFADALKRINGVRRLVEYKQSLDRPNAILRCGEHIEIANLLLGNERKEASDMMLRHLLDLSHAKIAEWKEGQLTEYVMTKGKK